MGHYFTEPMHRVGRAAQVAGAVNAILGAVLVGLTFVALADDRAGVPLGLPLGVLYLLLGLGLVFLAYRMESAELWAFYVTCGVAALLLLQALGDMAALLAIVRRPFIVRPLLCGGVVHLPHLYLVVECLIAFPEARHLSRARRREEMSRRRGFEPIMAVPPPPPPPRRQ